MHKAILKTAFATAFGLLESAIGLLATAYGFIADSGENVVTLIQKQVQDLRKSTDDAIDQLP